MFTEAWVAPGAAAAAPGRAASGRTVTHQNEETANAVPEQKLLGAGTTRRVKRGGEGQPVAGDQRDTPAPPPSKQEGEARGGPWAQRCWGREKKNGKYFRGNKRHGRRESREDKGLGLGLEKFSIFVWGPLPAYGAPSPPAGAPVGPTHPHNWPLAGIRTVVLLCWVWWG